MIGWAFPFTRKEGRPVERNLFQFAREEEAELPDKSRCKPVHPTINKRGTSLNPVLACCYLYLFVVNPACCYFYLLVMWCRFISCGNAEIMQQKE